MPSKRALSSIDVQISALAGRQFGVVSRAQLLVLGVRAHQIDDRVSRGWLIPLHRGVYAVGHAALRVEGRWLAAVFAAGAGAVLSHVDAAALWELVPAGAGRVHVSIGGRAGRRRRPGLVIHRPIRLPAEETTVRRGIPVTSPARTLVDLAEVSRGPAIRRALAQAEVLRIFDLGAIEQAIAAQPARVGARRLARAVDEQVGEIAITRSALEERFLRIAASAGLPRPCVNQVVAGLEVDFFWPGLGLVVETDGFRFHGTRSAFERDRERDALLLAAGLLVLRFTHRAVVRTPRDVQRRLRAVAGRAQGAFPGP